MISSESILIEDIFIENPVFYKGDIVFFITAYEHWTFQKQKYEKRVMALMLIDILHEQGKINDKTYRKIQMKYK